MIAFLDTEFTDLNAFPRLLSIGLVTGGTVDDDFYAEVTDYDRLRDASAFASHTVLPQFGRVDHADCRYLEVGARLWAFFDRRIDALGPSETLEVVFEYDLDWSLTRRAIEDVSRSRWQQLEGRLRPRNVYRMPGFQAGDAASDRYFDAQELEPLARHHALCDARALRIYYQAATDSASTQRSQAGGSPAFGRIAA